MKLSTGVHSIYSAFISIVLVLGMQACGGGGSAPAPLPDQDGSGIYSGTATVDVNTNITDLRGMIYNNRFMFFSTSATPHVLYDGTITSITSDNYTATVDVYENGELVPGKTGVTVTGKVRTATSITGTIGTAGTAGNHNGTFSLTYSNEYERAGTAARIEATGFNQATGTAFGSLDLSATYAFQTNLDFIARTEGVFSCLISNVYSIPDATVNMYAFTNMDIVDSLPSSDICPDSYEGTGYSGMASVVDDGVGGTDNRILIAYSNGTNSVFSLLTKP